MISLPTLLGHCMTVWDNKEEFPHLATYPHHHHDRDGHVNESPLTGDPVEDLEMVLQQLDTELS